jgi:hypothetical protein
MDVLGTVELLVIDYRLHQLQMRLRHSHTAARNTMG